MKRSSPSIFLSVIKALFVREMNVRLGRHKISYLAMAIEPLVPIFLFTMIHSLIGTGTLSQNDYIVFLFSGFLPYSSMKNMITKSSDAIEANQGLFIYKQVKPIDAIFARTFTEFFTFLISILAFILLGSLFLDNIIPYDILTVLSGFSLLFLFGLSMSVFVGSVCVFVPMLKKIVSFLFIPLMFFSAIFYTVGTLPPEFHEYILYNPLAQIMELIHGGWLSSLSVVEPDFVYLLFWITVPGSIGLIIYNHISKPILMKR